MLGPPKACKKQAVALKPHLPEDTSLPHLVSLFPAPPIPALLIGRNVITQAPSNNNNTNTNNTNSNNNTSNKRNPKTQSQEKYAAFNIKW